MKKGLIIASVASVMAISAGCAFAISANRGIRFEAAKADPETAEIKFDKDHHGLGETAHDAAGSTFWREYDAPSTNANAFAACREQVKYVKENTEYNFEPADSYFTFTAGTNCEFCMQLEVAGAITFSWDISYTGLDETHKGSIYLTSRGQYWGYVSSFHSSSLLNNGDHDIDISTLSSPYYLQLDITDLPEGASISINSITVSYSISDCKTARGL